MRAQEFIKEEHVVYSSIAHAEKFAKATNKKVVLSTGGYFKVVNKDAPGVEVEMRPDIKELRNQKTQEVENLVKQLDDMIVSLRSQRIPFYDKKWNPVRRGEQQLAKLRAELRYLKTSDATYRKVGQEEQLDELSFLGSQCTKDCSGHRAGYAWSKRKGTVPNSRSPSFNKGAALQAAGK
jgi:hypothetical protein